MMSVLNLHLQDIHKQLDNKELTVTELVEAALARVTEVDEHLNAFITITEDEARAYAAQLDKQVEEKGRGLLFGIPGGIKDNISTKGVKTTCASRMLSN